MPINLPWTTKQRSLEDAQAEDEALQVEYSIEQKKAAIRKLKQQGLTGKQFGWNWSSIMSWLRSH